MILSDYTSGKHWTEWGTCDPPQSYTAMGQGTFNVKDASSVLPEKTGRPHERKVFLKSGFLSYLG